MPKNKIKIPPELCVYADIADLPLMPPTRRRALKASDDGLFCAYIRLHGPYSEPVWKRADIMTWLREKFGKLLPDVIKEIELSGALVPPPKSKPKPKLARKMADSSRTGRVK